MQRHHINIYMRATGSAGAGGPVCGPLLVTSGQSGVSGSDPHVEASLLFSRWQSASQPGPVISLPFVARRPG